MRNGRVFLIDTFLQNEALADAVNNLLVVGFYLINAGYVALALKYGDAADRPRRGDRDPEHQGRPRPARAGRDALLQPLRLLEDAEAGPAKPEAPVRAEQFITPDPAVVALD